ncbi:hypothetical protein EC988_002527 [Linderina pennispora]|nr:hypothetical protein EC988_002527 [Linderina pennispora]
MFRSICDSRVRPYFASSGTAKPQFVLESSNSKADTRMLADNKQWRTHQQCIAAFMWAFEHLPDDDMVAVISYILPVALDLAEDYDAGIKVRGIKLVLRLLDRMDREFLRKSGIASLLEKSVLDSLVFRSGESAGAGTQLMDVAFAAAVRVSQTLYPRMDNPKYTAAWWKIADCIVRNSMYVSDNVVASTVLCKWIAPVCNALGPAVARYLKPLLGVVLQNLRAPVYLTPEILELQLVSVEQLGKLMDACPPRVGAHADEILAGLAISWAMTGKKQSTKTAGIDGLQNLIIMTTRKLQGYAPESVKVTWTC